MTDMIAALDPAEPVAVAAPVTPVEPVAPVASSPEPGMPRTGLGVVLPLVALVLSALALGGGMVARRKGAA